MLHLSGCGQETLIGFYGKGNELLGLLKDDELLDQLRLLLHTLEKLCFK